MNLACLMEIKKVLHPRNTLSLSNLTLNDFLTRDILLYVSIIAHF